MMIYTFFCQSIHLISIFWIKEKHEKNMKFIFTFDVLEECCKRILISVMRAELFCDSCTEFGEVEIGCDCSRLVCWLSAIFEVYIDKIMKKNYKSIELMEVTTYDLCLWCIFKWVVFLGRIFTSIADFDNLVFLDWCRC